MILHVIAGIPCQISDQFVFFFSRLKRVALIIYDRHQNLHSPMLLFHVT